MGDVTNELPYEILKSMQGRMDKLEAGQSEIRQELISIRGHMIAIQQDTHNIYGILGRHHDRPERIERRLELRELAEGPQKPYDPSPSDQNP
ncbi:hypothetical protein ACFPOD_00865 [Nitratireductor kimnyeongensis]|uniref:Uncharacterized protein n=1 Tax=Nitratireductor kimnyeongensis TaxID=430679 RepID=A0ABW0T3V4_9HYPH|nr:hypothetical protein [Nitratireductor kimnyeongensis]QZZ35300.1 hypothetical protein KW403_16330 [Nitratireductor kimnyeongensis]